jgi:hypothetical protein
VQAETYGWCDETLQQRPRLRHPLFCPDRRLVLQRTVCAGSGAGPVGFQSARRGRVVAWRTEDLS